jgi:hypothetical protein
VGSTVLTPVLTAVAGAPAAAHGHGSSIGDTITSFFSSAGTFF